MRHPAAIALEALLNGQTINLFGKDVMLCEDEDGHLSFGFEATKIEGDTKKTSKIMLGLEIDLVEHEVMQDALGSEYVAEKHRRWFPPHEYLEKTSENERLQS